MEYYQLLKENKFYPRLKMLKSGIDALTVPHHADHHGLSITTRYANHADPRLVETISRRAPGF